MTESVSADRTLSDESAARPSTALLPILAELFCSRAGREQVTLAIALQAFGCHDDTEVWVTHAIREGVCDRAERIGEHLLLTTSHATFWQHPQPWMRGPSSAGMPLRYTVTDERRHPVRPPDPKGVIYERFFPQIGMTFSLRTAEPDVDADVDVFSGWMNLDRVAHFWEQRGTRDEHAAYLRERRDDPHTLPTLGCFDGKPFGYFEFYWAKEDRIAPFYDAHDFDRGLHLLIGDARFQSAGKLKAWWSGVLHYMFVDEPRTQRLVGEPRVDHVRHIAYMHRLGFRTLKEFDFPHKRAALTVIDRETFFNEFGL